MITPNLPMGKWVNDDGHILPEVHGILSQLTSQLQQFFSNEGMVVPQQPTANITALSTTQSVGALLYDSDTNELKVNINGTFKVVQVV